MCKRGMKFVLLFVLLFLLSFETVYAAPNPVVVSKNGITVSAESASSLKSIRVIDQFLGEPSLGVMGGRPFKLSVTARVFFKPDKILIALSDGNIYDITEEGSLKYTCEYVMPYYALVIVAANGKEPKSLSFWIFPAWWPKDAHLIPTDTPELVKPEYKDDAIQKVVDEWWESTVLRLESERRT